MDLSSATATVEVDPGKEKDVANGRIIVREARVVASSSQRRRSPSARRPAPTPRRHLPSSPSRLATVTWSVSPVSGFVILPLRLFLGITFVYAGIQKLTDPGFFKLGAPTYIGTQMVSFSRNSPIHFILVHLLEHAVIIGALTIVTELTIGVLVLLGLFTRLAALAGLALNMGFFLTASWGVYPYFMGSDIVFVMAWITLALAGPGGFCLEPFAMMRLRRYLSPQRERLLFGPWHEIVGSGGDAAPATLEPVIPATRGLITRGEALLGGIAAIVLFVLGVIPRARASLAATGSPPSSSSSPSRPSSPSGGATAPKGARKVATVSQIPVNSGLAVTDPKSGDPAVVVHTDGSNFYAYDAVCTHAGCTVQYDPQYKLLVCPCHGGAFNPGQGGAVVAGPPPAPLAGLAITIDANGNVYLA